MPALRHRAATAAAQSTMHACFGPPNTDGIFNNPWVNTTSRAAPTPNRPSHRVRSSHRPRSRDHGSTAVTIQPRPAPPAPFHSATTFFALPSSQRRRLRPVVRRRPDWWVRTRRRPHGAIETFAARHIERDVAALETDTPQARLAQNVLDPFADANANHPACAAQARQFRHVS